MKCCVASRRGLTLVEIVVVMAVIGMLLSMSTIAVKAITGVDLKAASRKVAANMRWTYNSAAIAGVHYRMVIDLDNGTYETEIADKRFLLAQSKRQGARGDDRNNASNLEEDELGDRKQVEEEPRSQESAEDGDDFDSNEEGGSTYSFAGDYDAGKQTIAFTKVTDRIIKETQLPDGLKFAGVFTSHQQDLYTEGTATINFFPNGFAEPALILLSEKKDDELYWQLHLHPLTGRVKITKFPQEEFELPSEFGVEQFVEDESL